jgi:hypothetical protein
MAMLYVQQIDDTPVLSEATDAGNVGCSAIGVDILIYFVFQLIFAVARPSVRS